MAITSPGHSGKAGHRRCFKAEIDREASRLKAEQTVLFGVPQE